MISVAAGRDNILSKKKELDFLSADIYVTSKLYKKRHAPETIDEHV